jgi:hypothetical protein
LGGDLDDAHLALEVVLEGGDILDVASSGDARLWRVTPCPVCA